MWDVGRVKTHIHILYYEIAGVSGAFVTGLGSNPRLGNNYAFIITPIVFILATVIWFFISSFWLHMNNPDDEIMLANELNCFKSVLQGFVLFEQSVFIDGKIIFTNRKFIWL